MRYGDEHAACVEESDRLIRERDDWRRRYEALRDGVTGLFPEANDRGWGDGAVTIRNATCREVVRAVVARVEESATEYVPCGCDFHGDHAGCDATCATRGCSDPQTQEG